MDPDGGDESGFFQKLVNLYNLQKLADEIVMAGVEPGSHFRLSEETIKSLHGVCMDRLIPTAGSYRDGPVGIRGSNHTCPSHLEVGVHMASMCRYVNENWKQKNLLHLSAFCLWRMCWIHPFMNGNGRTARAVSYMVMCARHGQLLPAKYTVVTQIQEKKARFYQELGRADALWAATQDIDTSVRHLEEFMAEMLKAQLQASFA